MIELKNINILYDNKECIINGYFKALSNEITGICGESGTGKTSLLYVIGMITANQCDYYFQNNQLNFNSQQMSDFRNKHVSFITQNANIFETISIEKNIEFFLNKSGSLKTVEELLTLVHLLDKKDALPINLSGGERQRVAIACALANNSDIILGDEITSALDDENTSHVLDILSECAKQGKIVVLVTHEEKVLEQCNRVYELNHLSLIEKKYSQTEKLVHHNYSDNIKQKVLNIFEMLFYSNKKTNLLRVLFTFIMTCTLFVATSLSISTYETKNNLNLYSDNVLNRKLVFFSDIDGSNGSSDGYILGVANPNEEKILNEDISMINQLPHIESIYDYYVFQNGFSFDGRKAKMALNVFRNGESVDKKTTVDSPFYYIDDQTKLPEYDYFVVPYYEEENLSNEEGIIVNEHLAYLYNIEVGDTVEMKLNVPFASAKSLETYTSSFNNKRYNSQFCIYAQTNLTSKVIDIIDSNARYDSVIYMKNEQMKDLISTEIKKYKSGEIKIDNGFIEGFYEIEDLNPYAKTAFIDQYSNVLKVQDIIKNNSDTLYVYNEYYTVNKVLQEYEGQINSSFVIGVFSTSILVLAAFIISLIHLNKYKSTYMMLNLIGFKNELKNKVYAFHWLWQFMIMMCFGLVIYAIGSLPHILSYLNIATYDKIMNSVPHIYYVIHIYCSFSIKHFVLLTTMIMFVTVVSNVLIVNRYNKQSLVKWLRSL